MESKRQKEEMMSEKGPSSGSSNNPCLINPMDLVLSPPPTTMSDGMRDGYCAWEETKRKGTHTRLSWAGPNSKTNIVAYRHAAAPAREQKK